MYYKVLENIESEQKRMHECPPPVVVLLFSDFA